MGLDQEQPEDFLTLRREVTGRPREFLPVEQGAAELSGKRKFQGWITLQRLQTALSVPRDVRRQLLILPLIFKGVIHPNAGHHHIQEVTTAGTGFLPLTWSVPWDLLNFLKDNYCPLKNKKVN